MASRLYIMYFNHPAIQEGIVHVAYPKPSSGR
jgi:hypothetical protein